MARTNRNKNTVPHGWVVRDDGYPYKGGLRDFSCPKYRRSWMSKDTKEDRKGWQTRYRARVKHLMVQERWEDIPPFIKTCGWLSW